MRGVLKLEGPEGSALIASIVLAVPHASLLQPNDEGITKNEFPFVIWKSLEPKTGPGSKQEDRGPPPGALELSSALSTALAHFSVISYPPQNLLTENVGKYSLSTVQ